MNGLKRAALQTENALDDFAEPAYPPVKPEGFKIVALYGYGRVIRILRNQQPAARTFLQTLDQKFLAQPDQKNFTVLRLADRGIHKNNVAVADLGFHGIPDDVHQKSIFGLHADTVQKRVAEGIEAQNSICGDQRAPGAGLGINFWYHRILRHIHSWLRKADTEEIAKQDYILTPGRYVGIEEQEDDGEPFEEKMDRLTKELSELFQKSHELEAQIKERLGAIGYEV